MGPKSGKAQQALRTASVAQFVRMLPAPICDRSRPPTPWGLDLYLRQRSAGHLGRRPGDRPRHNLEEEYEATGKGMIFRELSSILFGGGEGTYAEVATRIQMT